MSEQATIVGRWKSGVRAFLRSEHAIQPQRGFTTKPGVAAVRRTPGMAIGKSVNPEGVPQSSNPDLGRIVEPRWGSARFGRLFLGCAVFTATPGFVVEPLSGFEHNWTEIHIRDLPESSVTTKQILAERDREADQLDAFLKELGYE